jgi:predicted dinucleotide-binding enzyme
LTTATIGVGNIGTAVARHLVGGDESVVVAAKDASHADALAQQLGPGARAASVEDAITGAEVVVFALWLDHMKDVISEHASLLDGKVVVDPFKVGGVAAAVRIEMPGGDLHQYGSNGELLDLNQARAAIAARKVTA